MRSITAYENFNKANVPSPCAWQASLPIFGWGMRTHIPRLTVRCGAIWSRDKQTKEKHRIRGALNSTGISSRRIYPHPAPGKPACRSSGGVCEPISRASRCGVGRFGAGISKQKKSTAFAVLFFCLVTPTGIEPMPSP